MIHANIRNLFKSLTIAIILTLISFDASAKYDPEDMPNVNVSNRYEYVSDPGNLLDAQTKEKVNKLLWDLRQSTTAEVAVALPPDIGDTPIEEWSEQLFTSWGIGKSDKDNGVLLVIAPEQRMARIQTGYGTEGILTDIACKKIITNDIAPNMTNGDIDSAVIAAVSTIIQALTDPNVAEELRSNNPDNFRTNTEALDSEVLTSFIMFVIGAVFLLSLFALVIIGIKLRGKDAYHKALKWRGDLHIFGWLALCSLGLGLISYFIAYLLYRHYRTTPRRCSTCGHKMIRLPEDKDNDFLSSSEDFEEKLNTVDYDVWECPDCGTLERFPFKTKQLKYSECPNCGTVAMQLIAENTVRNATLSHEGLKEKIYECKYCHHQKRIPIVIPKKEVPVVVVPPIGGRGGGNFGSGIGGGFGGGSTGGGGASGGW